MIKTFCVNNQEILISIVLSCELQNQLGKYHYVNMSLTNAINFSRTQALIFDLMGTCCDWHSSLMPVLSECPKLPSPQTIDLSQLAANWRAGFFKEIHARYEAARKPEDIDVTHRRVLDRLLSEHGISIDTWDEGVRKKLVNAWHHQQGNCASVISCSNTDFHSMA